MLLNSFNRVPTVHEVQDPLNIKYLLLYFFVFAIC